MHEMLRVCAPIEAELYINVLELKTIIKALSVLDVRNRTLVVWSDNQVAISVVQRLGSRSLVLQGVTVDLAQDWNFSGSFWCFHP